MKTDLSDSPPNSEVQSLISALVAVVPYPEQIPGQTPSTRKIAQKSSYTQHSQKGRTLPPRTNVRAATLAAVLDGVDARVADERRPRPVRVGAQRR